MNLDALSFKDAWEMRRALSSLMREYKDRQSQFGDDILWKKHEDTEVIERAEAIIERSYRKDAESD